MKTIAKVFCLAGFLVGFTASNVSAGQSERLLTFAFTGFFQDRNRAGHEIAVPFRLTTRDILEEIHATTGANVVGGTLLVIESLDDVNAPFRIVARKKNQVDTDVTEFFQISQGSDVRTTRFSQNTFVGATFHAIDQIKFLTVTNDAGLDLSLQLITVETQRILVKKIDGARVNVVSTDSSSQGNGELRSGNGFIGPVKGTVRIRAPKFIQTPESPTSIESGGVVTIIGHIGSSDEDILVQGMTVP